MKTAQTLLALSILFPLTEHAGDFTDLDFENVRRPLPIIGGTPASKAFPGWTATLNGVALEFVLYNDETLGSGSVDLFSTFPPGNEDSAIRMISGNYTAYLQGGAGLAALAQTGTIPEGSRALVFNSYSFLGPIEVSLDGSRAPTFALGHTTTGEHSGYDTLAVDVSAMAGQEVKLSFSSPSLGGSAALDDIRFSSLTVPEPSTWALFGLGLAALAWFGRRR